MSQGETKMDQDQQVTHEPRQIVDQDGTKLFDSRVHFRNRKSGKIEEAKTAPYRRVAWKDEHGNRFAVYAEDLADGTTRYYGESGEPCAKPEVPCKMATTKNFKPTPEGVPHDKIFVAKNSQSGQAR